MIQTDTKKEEEKGEDEERWERRRSPLVVQSSVLPSGPNFLGHLEAGRILYVSCLVVVRGHLQQPLVLYLNNLREEEEEEEEMVGIGDHEEERVYLSHVLLRSEDQLVVDDPSWLLLKQTAVGMNVDGLLVFNCPVTTLGEP